MTPFDFDVRWLLALNFDGGNCLDQVMYVISGIATWIPLYAAVVGWVFWKKGWRAGLLVLLAGGLMILCTDQVVNFFKNNIPKLRPTHFLGTDLVHTVNGYMGGLYGTVSGHAANALAFAIFSGMIVRKNWYWWAIILWVLVVSYSRIYLGVHYPMDIFFGILTGSCFGFAWYYIYIKVAEKLKIKAE